MKIIPLSEGAFSIDKTKVFVQFNKDADSIQERATGSLLVEIQPFVLVGNKDITPTQAVPVASNTESLATMS